MERRTFVGASIATLCSASAVASADRIAGSHELFEIRTYTLKPAKQPSLEEYLSQAYLPALKRLGVGPVGVFVEPVQGDTLKVYVLVVHKNAASVASLPALLHTDAEYQKAANAFLAAKADDPAYLRIESSLLEAIGGMPKLERPDTSKARLLNLRIYKSHNERSAAKKVEMFERGELEIFRRVGLTPVFFASAIVGASMPNLTYMLTFPDDVALKAAWDKFRSDPDWLKLRAIPEYADKEIVSKITNKVLKPTSYSEI